MKLVEFVDNPVDDSLPFDVVDDVSVYMRNDPMFYRKHFFPTMVKISGLVKNKKKINPIKALGPLVDMACEGYCEKFNVGRTSKDLFDDDDRKALIGKLYSEEMENIRKGEY